MRETPKIVQRYRTIFSDLLVIFQVKVRKTPNTWSPNLYHLKKHYLFKIEQINKKPQLYKKEEKCLSVCFKSEYGNTRLKNGFGLAIRQFTKYRNVLMLPIQHPTAQGAVVNE